MQYSQEYIDWKNSFEDKKEYLMHLYELCPEVYYMLNINKNSSTYINRGLIPLWLKCLYNYNNPVTQLVLEKISLEDSCYVSWLYKNCNLPMLDKTEYLADIVDEFLES